MLKVNSKKIKLIKNSPDKIESLNLEKPFLFRVNKRIIDIIFSFLICLLVLSWLIPILAILIKIDSKGPVFFKQLRTGYKGKTFNCLKLRTMRVNSSANYLQASINDPRITNLGKFLRKSNLDELPQFINVLIGDMSIVGPRPHMITDSIEFSQLFPEYYNRYSVKPGITGLAQACGFRGPTLDKNLLLKRLQLDLWYMKTHSLSLDFNIILLTAEETIREIFKIKVN